MALANCLSMTGVIIVTMGTVLGIIGMATSNWFAVEYNDPTDTLAGSWPTTWPNVTDCAGSYGLWQVCCTGEPCQLRAVDSNMQAMRIMLIVMLAVLVVSVIGLLIFMFSEGLQESRMARQCISWFVATGCIGYILVVMGIILTEFAHGFFARMMPYRDSDLDWTDWPYGVALDWSFYATGVGALISPIGIFLICTQWHFSDDKESGISKVNYDKAAKIEGSVVDTYM